MKKEKLVVEKDRFDFALQNMLRTKPVPRTSIKSTGKRGPKTPILSK